MTAPVHIPMRIIVVGEFCSFIMALSRTISFSITNEALTAFSASRRLSASVVLGIGTPKLTFTPSPA
jgi:hypothetical protein